jgi:protocatechuate 3,4-dioxygenase beta subunit
MDNDDLPLGRVLSRRELLGVLGVAGASAFLGCRAESSATDLDETISGGSTSCVVRPEQTEGPYFVDERLQRSDIRSDPFDGSIRAGVPLALTFLVSRISGTSCSALAGAYVDIWHCDALGVYSDATDPGFNTIGRKFLRGYQVTDADGQARFTTIYPGWYQGRTVHIHFKIRTALTAQAFDFTSQLYFDDALSDTIHAQQPYAAKGQRTLRNAGDGIYRSGGSQLLLSAEQTSARYAAEFRIGMQMA